MFDKRDTRKQWVFHQRAGYGKRHAGALKHQTSNQLGIKKELIATLSL
jgi:hypothetical protein